MSTVVCTNKSRINTTYNAHILQHTAVASRMHTHDFAKMYDIRDIQSYTKKISDKSIERHILNIFRIL